MEQGTKIVHCKRERYDVLIDRTTKWGNPFKITASRSREQVISDYRNWVMGQTDLLESLPELQGKTLGCWCAPKSCHGDVLAALCEELL